MSGESKISYRFASERFASILNRIEQGGTTVYEVRSKPLTVPRTICEMLEQLNPGDVIWQHTPQYHVAAVKIIKGHGWDYGRNYLDLIYNGIDTPEKFEAAWAKRNGKNAREGYVPRSDKNTSVTSAVRAQQESYVVAKSLTPNRNSKIAGSLGIDGDSVDRTHLIPVTVTGIENHKGLLIDYDSWLNRNPMVKFEQEVLKLNRYKTLYWIAFIQQLKVGLVWRYYIFDLNHQLVRKARWIDDRWDYEWWHDPAQELIQTRGKQ